MITVFIDSSVLIAAFLSPTGGSARIIELCEAEIIKGYTSMYVLDEVGQVFKRKFGKESPNLKKLLKSAKISLAVPTAKAINKAKKWISDGNDAPVLAAAAKAKVDYLATLDIRDFIKDTTVAKKSGLKILTPGDFLQRLYEELSA